jgi:hypothetical protein
MDGDVGVETEGGGIGADRLFDAPPGGKRGMVGASAEGES